MGWLKRTHPRDIFPIPVWLLLFIFCSFLLIFCVILESTLGWLVIRFLLKIQHRWKIKSLPRVLSGILPFLIIFFSLISRCYLIRRWISRSLKNARDKIWDKPPCQKGGKFFEQLLQKVSKIVLRLYLQGRFNLKHTFTHFMN